MTNTITWQQLATFTLCIAAAFAAHNYLGADAGMTAGVVTSVIAFLMGRTAPKDEQKDGAK